MDHRHWRKVHAMSDRVIHSALLCMTRINGGVSGLLAFESTLADIGEAIVERFQMVDD